MLLAIESSDRLCGACVLDPNTGRVAASKTIDIGKGHAELLIGVIEEVLTLGGCGYAKLKSIAVCVGPGSFTGIRVGVSAAIGFGVALNIPVAGVTSLQALAMPHLAGGAKILSLIDAHRGDVYAQSFSSDGLPLDEPRQIALEKVAEFDLAQYRILCGSGAVLLQAAYPALNLAMSADGNMPAVESIAVAALNPAFCVAAKPLYLRRPDAKPQESYTIARALR
jgi:tRNA threonylcarbamoyladenosine biosynthesis protein TsaB